MNRYLQEIHKANTPMVNTVIVDLDGVLTDFENCHVCCDYSGYPDKYTQLSRSQCPVRAGASEFLAKLKKSGYIVVIYTSRIFAEKKVTEDWLKKHNLVYNYIVWNKPRGIAYIDDLAHEFKSFKEAEECLKNRSSPKE